MKKFMVIVLFLILSSQIVYGKDYTKPEENKLNLIGTKGIKIDTLEITREQLGIQNTGTTKMYVVKYKDKIYLTPQSSGAFKPKTGDILLHDYDVHLKFATTFPITNVEDNTIKYGMGTTVAGNKKIPTIHHSTGISLSSLEDGKAYYIIPAKAAPGAISIRGIIKDGNQFYYAKSLIQTGGEKGELILDTTGYDKEIDAGTLKEIDDDTVEYTQDGNKNIIKRDGDTKRIIHLTIKKPDESSQTISYIGEKPRVIAYNTFLDSNKEFTIKYEEGKIELAKDGRKESTWSLKELQMITAVDDPEEVAKAMQNFDWKNTKNLKELKYQGHTYKAISPSDGKRIIQKRDDNNNVVETMSTYTEGTTDVLEKNKHNPKTGGVTSSFTTYRDTKTGTIITKKTEDQKTTYEYQSEGEKIDLTEKAMNTMLGTNKIEKLDQAKKQRLYFTIENLKNNIKSGSLDKGFEGENERVTFESQKDVYQKLDSNKNIIQEIAKFKAKTTYSQYGREIQAEAGDQVKIENIQYEKDQVTSADITITDSKNLMKAKIKKISKDKFHETHFEDGTTLSKVNTNLLTGKEESATYNKDQKVFILERPTTVAEAISEDGKTKYYHKDTGSFIDWDEVFDPKTGKRREKYKTAEFKLSEKGEKLPDELSEEQLKELKNRENNAEEFKANIEEAKEQASAIQKGIKPQTKSSKFIWGAAEFLGAYKPMNQLSNLFFGEKNMNAWREQVDSFFASMFLGVDYWTSAICRNEFKVVGRQVAFIDTPAPGGMGVQFVGRIEATKEGPYPITCNQQNRTCEECQDGLCIVNGRPAYENFYKISYGLQAPNPISYNILLTGLDSNVVYSDFVPIKAGQIKKDILAKYSSANYDTVCIVFKQKPKSARSGQIDKICNKVSAGVSSAAENTQTIPPPQSGGIVETNW